MFQRSVASRLALLYATIFGVTILLVVLASAIALIAELSHFELELMIGKQQQARFIAQGYQDAGLSLRQAAPAIVNELSNLGTRVAVFDQEGAYIAGDRTLHPPGLDRMLALRIHQLEALNPVTRFPRVFVLPPGQTGPPLPIGHGPPTRSVTAVAGGFVGIETSLWLLLGSLMPYWFVVLGLALGATVLSWFGGRLVAAQALRPLNDVTDSLLALADGDYTQRRFVMAGGDEIATLTGAYNDAAASVASAMEQRRATEERMRLFVADAGHELRTPLTVIGGYIDVLRRGAVEEVRVARQILSTMALEKEHMRGLIDRLMRLARLDAEAGPNAEPINVVDLLRSQCDAARRYDEQRTIDYSVDGATEIVADRAELGEALWNILENALKYAPESPIHLSALRSNGHTTISVRDEGPGMSEPERLHAFERFYRGDQRGEIAGSGLGLSIAKRAVERAGGAIGIESAPGRGTTVSITLENPA
jgi:signal transduction histidine kinase